MFNDVKIGDFMNSLASVEPVPGGGSAGALGGAMGAALVIMALRISFKKSGLTEEAESFISRLENDRIALEKLADLDSEAYASVMKAFGMPKESEEDKSARREAIQSALKHAAEIPMKTAESCFRVMNSSFEAFGLCGDSCFSDAASGFCFARTGFQCALFNVDINLSSIKDDDFVKSMRERKSHMSAWLSEHESELEKVFSDRIA
ncbi:MAG: cyclodeaminase/cyclohydrolase family protein [bacterium]|nr:cyclodeaminase/cyclohydrolase family protein [bacterium]